MTRAAAIAAIATIVCLAMPAVNASGAGVSSGAESCVNLDVDFEFNPPLRAGFPQFGSATARYREIWTCGFASFAATIDPNFPGVSPGAGVREWYPSYFVIPTGVTYSYTGNCAAAALTGGATNAVGVVTGGATIEIVHRDPHADVGALTETIQLARLATTDTCQQQLGLGVSTVTGAGGSSWPDPL